MRKTLTILTLLIVAAGSASAAELELTPFIGYRFGGDVPRESSEIFEVDVEVDEAAVYGMALDIKVGPGLLIELFASRQETEFVDDTGLFQPEDVLLDVDVTYYHVGVGWGWRINDVEPFVLGSLGIAKISPDAFGLHDEDEFSMSFGGGVKVWINNHVGFRFEGRGYWTDLGSSEDEWEFWDGYDDDLYQGEVKVGLVISF
jgi:opacity protein-like surface antigen